jgi:hypothetical protein
MPAVRTSHRPVDIRDFGFGLLSDRAVPPTQMPHGAALVSVNCDYAGRTIASRKGYSPVLENGPGATKVADFESGESWSGGAAETGADNFVLVEAGADGARSRALTATGGGGEVAATLTVALDLSGRLLDWFHIWLKALTFPATITAYTATLRFQTSGGNYYQVTVAADTDAWNALEAGRAKYHRFRRQEFVATGSPDWSNITQIRVALTATGTGSLIVAFDNLHRTPGVMQDLFQFQRQSGDYSGASGQYAVTGGALYRQDGKRWTQVFTGFDPVAPVYSITAQDRRLLSDGITSPRVMLSDGSTVYRLGIVTPSRTITATQIAGGKLSDQKYFVMVLFYSSKTGTFSAPDKREQKEADALVEITGGGNAAGIRFSNIPVSADPQVDWVVIGVRPDSEPEAFYRITDGAFGDVANGTTTFDWTGDTASVSILVERTQTVLDPDMDYPSVVDPDTMLPVEAHPLYLEEIGGYVVCVMAEQPSVIRISRKRAPGSWALDDEQPLGENDSEPVTAIHRVSGNLFASKPAGVYGGVVVDGDAKIRFEGPYSNNGAVEQKGFVRVGHEIYYRGSDGAYRCGPDMTPRLVTGQQVPIWHDLWDPEGFGYGAGVYIEDRQQVVLGGRTLGAATNDRGWVVHAVEPGAYRGERTPQAAPTQWTVPAEAAAEVESQAGIEAWIGGRGQVWRLNSGHEDDGRQVETTHRTPMLGQAPAYAGRWAWMDVEARASGSVSMTVKTYIGAAMLPDQTASVSLKDRSAPLGEFVLGTSKLGAALYVHDRVRLPPKVARYISFEFYFKGRVPVEIVRVTPWYQPIGPWRATA